MSTPQNKNTAFADGVAPAIEAAIDLGKSKLAAKLS